MKTYQDGVLKDYFTYTPSLLSTPHMTPTGRRATTSGTSNVAHRRSIGMQPHVR